VPVKETFNRGKNLQFVFMKTLFYKKVLKYGRTTSFGSVQKSAFPNFESKGYLIYSKVSW